MYDFDQVVDRRHTHSRKHDMVLEKYGVDNDEAIPLWVADMDFESPQCVREALIDYIEHGALGYGGDYEDIYKALIAWYKRRHGLELNREWLSFGSTIIDIILRAIRTYTDEGDKILIQPPVYHQFANMIKHTNRTVIENPLKLQDGKYYMDLDNLKTVIKENKDIKMMILCNPHNPVGRAWSKKELQELSKMLIENNILIISDDAHCELVHNDYKHNFLISLGKEVADNTITCISCHKTFNLCGLQISNVIIPNKSLRERYELVLEHEHGGDPNILGAIAIKAAYEKGDVWLSELLDYLKGNYDYLKDYVKRNIPKAKVIESEATFLAWIDLRDFGLNGKELEEFLNKESKVILSQGYSFGNNGDGFVRLNFACSREVLEKALERLKESLKELN
ncbi:MAG: pyridoxal phosphate-dependent aminotransferase [Clostridium sp.]|uniref:MalY/PatB family protein n=1 Tax=Clostridium sp. TaxID=1506 RepID=UPI002A8AA4F3|nr:pyridoxal phosphate-dependent aminotransferase [Clostridium sp.]MDY5097382.1 MalY/PatB family protein [Clostridium sp.]